LFGSLKNSGVLALLSELVLSLLCRWLGFDNWQ
jgi:hypothetical protein